ncbi:Metal dependent phosphohydrolase [Tepidanaerobacter acetatoxydans Re1]|uniref:Metal dependent phosphohydrolase n=1 Tax=Tepidanaerobacter acetatoxydans (strain DSM 21804 / JCM 16047 / Re1) TaxID=1209989 RepID=F4LX92_TEPAE|nr:HD domain-containing protein [Tepidanaerobacter acetatoxydans]AEE91891.1 metal dependent phosphohydrolase [Tepidanaerobacter acetatoxydans Re1]CCP26710.1 Metal dependent phosphohydrolase [Tepidanaerobacter acetatoxydans Re1]
MYYIRDPIHGFIEINELEKTIINQPEFQRLRRIKQLSLSDMVYPATNHTRFEHSLGVMHVATQMFDNIVKNEMDFLRNKLNYTESGLERERILIRLAGLLHDIGHPPFSHAAEELMPLKPDSAKDHYEHEDYSAAIIKNKFRRYIDESKFNDLKITADEVCDILTKGPTSSERAFWRHLISGQLDADRADYLLRDSYHAGVNYGRYDLKRILRTLTVINEPETDNFSIGINKSGWHAAEGLIIARYQMFTQVYFHHTRRAYDNHISEAIKTLLKSETKKDTFVPPTRDNLDEYLDWDDWKVGGLIKEGKAGLHGEIILNRLHYRRAYETKEVPSIEDLKEFEAISEEFKDKIGFIDTAEKSWYKVGDEDILISEEKGDSKYAPLSQYSSIARNLVPNKQIRIYVPYENKQEIKEQIKKYREEIKHDKRI